MPEISFAAPCARAGTCCAHGSARRLRAGRRDLAALVLASLAAAGCDVAFARLAGHICAGVGVCDEPLQPAPPRCFDILCDPSVGSSCSRATLDRALDAVLGGAVERPGSRIRLWMLGRNVAETVAVGEQAVPSFAQGSDRATRARTERFVATAREYFLAAANRAFDASPVHRSPLIEAIAKIGIADAGGLPRRIVVISDGREVSQMGDFECARLPSDAQFVATLRRHGVQPDLLAHVSVEFGFVESSAIPVRGCPVRVDREVRIRALWTAALHAAGAENVRIGSGPPRLAAGLDATEPHDGGAR